ncbi:hypothetical protein BPOR_0405g00080 [Botrytis porri]|uniref:Uncharacterized protein n=1 Tax=Botrytis porri TaxID=87229 RepID=A0A4Z1KM30_9HELO|nr:hypothetical protein BPOR_0405g00080 [Botrytis porri]
MASIEMTTHSGSLPPTSAGQDLVVSSSEHLATDTSLSNPTSRASSGAAVLNVYPVFLAPRITPTKLVSKRALWGWLKHTEIKTSPLTLFVTLLGLIAAVTYGTSTWILSSTAADATAKANRLALFTACISFSDQPIIVNSNFCRANSNASLDGFAKRDTAGISPPLLWNMDVLGEALQIVQPAWQCRIVCGQERVLHPPDLTLVLSIPVSSGENCHLDCLEPIQATFGAKKLFQKRFEALIAVVSFTIFLFFSRKCLAESTLNTIVTVITSHHNVTILSILQLELEATHLAQDDWLDSLRLQHFRAWTVHQRYCTSPDHPYLRL